jgi:hypothetical protein
MPARRHAAADEVGGLERERRRRPARRQRGERAPGGIVDTGPGTRPGDEDAVGETLGAEPIEKGARFAFAQRRRDLPPGVGDRRETLVLGIEETKPLPEAFGIFRHEHAERREPPHRIGGKAERGLEPGHGAGTGDERHAAQNRSENPRFAHHRQRRHRVRCDDQLHELGAHPLARQDAKSAAADNGGMQAGRIGSAVAVYGMKAEEAQDAQVVLGDARGRIADEAHAARRKVGESPDIVVHCAVVGDRQCVEGEVASLGVRPPVAPEAHLGSAPERLDVLPQRRHLERMAVDHYRDGAVSDAGGHRLEPCRFGAADHLGRQRRGGDVDLARMLAEKRVAHGPADRARLLAIAVEHGEEARQRPAREPGRLREVPVGAPGGGIALAHWVVPGTSLPFSICAGT